MERESSIIKECLCDKRKFPKSMKDKEKDIQSTWKEYVGERWKINCL